jgi:hypothetical protein
MYPLTGLADRPERSILHRLKKFVSQAELLAFLHTVKI